MNLSLSPKLSVDTTPVMAGRGGGETGESHRRSIKEPGYNEIQWRRHFKTEGVCSASFGLHVCWNWTVAPSVNISEEQTLHEKSQGNFGQLANPDTGSNIAGVWQWRSWTAEQEVTSVEGLSRRLDRMSWPGGGWLGPGQQHGMSPKDWMNLCPCPRRQEEKELFVPREMSVNQLTELSVKVWFPCSRQLRELCELACYNDGTWRVELPPVVQREENKY